MMGPDIAECGSSGLPGIRPPRGGYHFLDFERVWRSRSGRLRLHARRGRIRVGGAQRQGRTATSCSPATACRVYGGDESPDRGHSAVFLTPATQGRLFIRPASGTPLRTGQELGRIDNFPNVASIQRSRQVPRRSHANTPPVRLGLGTSVQTERKAQEDRERPLKSAPAATSDGFQHSERERARPARPLSQRLQVRGHSHSGAPAPISDSAALAVGI